MARLWGKLGGWGRRAAQRGRWGRRYAAALALAAAGGLLWRAGLGTPGAPAVIPGLYPASVAAGRDGSLFVCDYDNNCVWRIGRAGRAERAAGTGESGYSGDGGPAAQARLDEPCGIVLDGAGSLYVADHGNYRIRKVDGSDRIATVAGCGEAGYSGDGGPATQARLAGPWGITVGNRGDLYVADTDNYCVRRVDGQGIISTVAGCGREGDDSDGSPAAKAALPWPVAVACSAEGELYIADSDACRVRKVDRRGVIRTVAGTGKAGYSGDGGPAVRARLQAPCGIALDGDGNLYVADYDCYRVRKVDRRGIITTAAGNGQPGLAGDGGPAASARLGGPLDVCVDAAGFLYVAVFADAGDAPWAVRKVDRWGIIRTVVADHSRLWR